MKRLMIMTLLIGMLVGVGARGWLTQQRNQLPEGFVQCVQTGFHVYGSGDCVVTCTDYRCYTREGDSEDFSQTVISCHGEIEVFPFEPGSC